jgi:hypothetical protein
MDYLARRALHGEGAAGPCSAGAGHRLCPDGGRYNEVSIIRYSRLTQRVDTRDARLAMIGWGG